jgi:hypothetical protein
MGTIIYVGPLKQVMKQVGCEYHKWEGPFKDRAGIFHRCENCLVLNYVADEEKCLQAIKNTVPGKFDAEFEDKRAMEVTSLKERITNLERSIEVAEARARLNDSRYNRLARNTLHDLFSDLEAAEQRVLDLEATTGQTNKGIGANHAN